MQFKLDQTVQHKSSQKKLVVISNDILYIRCDSYLICRDEKYSIYKYKLNEIEEFKDQMDDIKLKMFNHIVETTASLELMQFAGMNKITTNLERLIKESSQLLSEVAPEFNKN